MLSAGGAFDRLPFDLVDVTLDILAAQHHDLGLHSLKQCALVCQAWLDLCRPHIWANLSIYACIGCGAATATLPNRISLRRFSLILYQREHVAQLIRHIDYHDRILCTHPSHSAPVTLFHALQNLSNLSSFSLYISSPAISAQKSQVVGIKLSSWCVRTISRLDLHVSANTPLPIWLVLENAANLKKLYIHSLESLNPPTSPQSTTTAAEPLRLEEFGFLCNQPRIFEAIVAANRNNQGAPAIDFSALEKAAFAIYHEQKFDVFRPVCDRSQRLVELELTLHIDCHQGLYGLLTPVLRTLQKLTLIHKPSGLEYEFLEGYAAEFQQLRGKNSLRCIHIVVELSWSQALYRFQTGDKYALLDETLTSSGWPALKEVEICVRVSSITLNGYLRQPVGRLWQWKSALEILKFQGLERSDQVKFSYLISI